MRSTKEKRLHVETFWVGDTTQPGFIHQSVKLRMAEKVIRARYGMNSRTAVRVDTVEALHRQRNGKRASSLSG